MVFHEQRGLRKSRPCCLYAAGNPITRSNSCTIEVPQALESAVLQHVDVGPYMCMQPMRYCGVRSQVEKEATTTGRSVHTTAPEACLHNSQDFRIRYIEIRTSNDFTDHDHDTKHRHGHLRTPARYEYTPVDLSEWITSILLHCALDSGLSASPALSRPAGLTSYSTDGFLQSPPADRQEKKDSV